MVQARAAASDRERASHSSPSTSALTQAGVGTWAIRIATFAGFALPAVGYLWMIHSYGVNVIFADQWDDITLIGHAYSGSLHFSTLWAQHYENRIFFPNLIVLALAYTTHLNVVVEEYLAALMAFGATALVILAHKRRSPTRRWIWYCPVAFLLLSLAQAPNALWGFQMAWYLVLLMIAAVIFFLDRPVQGPMVLGAAVAAGVVASFSSLQGLLVWPAGVVIIYLRRRPSSHALIWIAAAAVTSALYFTGFSFGLSQSTSNVTSHPLSALGFSLRVIGDVVGDQHPGAPEVLLGGLLVLASVWALVRFGRRRLDPGGRPVGLALVVCGLVFAGLTGYGRSDLLGNVEYRYTVFAMLVLVGLYLILLDRPVSGQNRPAGTVPAAGAIARVRRGVVADPLFTSARVLVGIAVALTVVAGTVKGISKARSMHDERQYTGRVTVRVDQYPGPVVTTLDWLETASAIRQQVAIARSHGLSLFGTGDAAEYLREKPLDLQASPLRASVAIPRSGSTLRGAQLLNAVVSDEFDVTSVDYYMSGSGLTDQHIAKGFRTNYGWFARWDTRDLPNGEYSIEAVVRDSGGRTVRTAPVEVHVRNQS